MKPLVLKYIIPGKISDSLKPLKMTNIEIRSPRYDPHPEKSLTQNWKWRKGFFPIFENGNYDWMPKFDEIDNMEKLDRLGYNFYIIFENILEINIEYYWVPSKKEIKTLVEKKLEIDKINSELASAHYKKSEVK